MDTSDCGHTYVTQRGFTLVEALLALTVLGLLAAATAPSFGALLAQRRLDGVTEEYRQHFYWARSHAIQTGQPVRIRIEQTRAGSCYVVFAGPQSACSCAASANPCNGPGQMLALVHLPEERGIHVAPRTQQSHLLIDPMRGTVTPALTAVFSSASGRVVHQVVNIMGRTYACSPGGARPGLTACPNIG